MRAFFVLPALAVLLFSGVAHADPGDVVFPGISCNPSFSCNDPTAFDSLRLANLAHRCLTRGFGTMFNAAITGEQDLDSEGCLVTDTEMIERTKSGVLVFPHCCVRENGDRCSLVCEVVNR